MSRSFRKDILRAIRMRNGITVQEMLRHAPEENRQEVEDTIRTLEHEGVISIDLNDRCTMPKAPTDGPHYSAEVSYNVYLAWSDAIGQFDKTPTYAEVMDWLGAQGILTVVYRMTQWWRIALRSSRDGTLLKDIRGDATDRKKTWQEAADAAILAAFRRVEGQ